MCPYGAFPLVDGALVLISIQNEGEWKRFCADFLADPGLAARPGFDSNNARVANRARVDALVALAFAPLDRAEATALLRKAGTAFDAFWASRAALVKESGCPSTGSIPHRGEADAPAPAS